MTELTAYEERALREIEAFKQPQESRLGALWRKASAPLTQFADMTLDTSAGSLVVKSIQDVLDMLNDGATWTVRTATIHDEFRRRGLGPIDGPRDIHKLGLHEVDRLVGSLSAKYQALAVTEGAASGVFGGIGIAADVGLLVGLCLRAVGEYATYYGFEIGQAPERAFAMSILSAASIPAGAERRAALTEVTRLSVLLAGGEPSAELESQKSAMLTKKVAQALVVRLVKAKVAQLVPLAGAAVAAGYNAWLVRSVSASAHQLYRERFLVEKHGDTVVSRLEK